MNAKQIGAAIAALTSLTGLSLAGYSVTQGGMEATPGMGWAMLFAVLTIGFAAILYRRPTSALSFGATVSSAIALAILVFIKQLTFGTFMAMALIGSLIALFNLYAGQTYKIAPK